MYEYIFSESESFIKWLNRILGIICFVAVVSIIIEYSFYLNNTWIKIIKYFNFFFIHFYFLQFIIKLVFSNKPGRYIKKHWFESIIAFLILLEILLVVRFSSLQHFLRNINFESSLNIITRLYIIFTQVIIFFTFIPEFIRYNQKFNSLRFHPSQLFLFSYIILIILGTLFLLLPKSVTFPNKISVIDSLFTTTSAVCVTGLIVVDTATYFTTFGQIIIILLIQIGGIGTITFASFLGILFGRGVGFRDRVVLNDLLNLDNFSLITTTLKKIILTVFFIEGAGAISLMFIWSNNNWPISKLIFHSIFHSISAFCNAGFSTFTNNLMDYKSNIGVNITIILLIIFGGLGFIVLIDIFDYMKSIFKKGPKKYLKVHSKIVLITTLILIIFGTISFLLLEKKFYQDEGFFNSMLAGLFISVTSRTAGFNTVDTGLLSVPMSLVVILLMFIGASPCSTGGGVKTSTFAVLWIGIFSIIKAKREIVLFKKKISFFVFNKAIIVLCIYLTILFISFILLSYFEKSNLLDLSFEATSGMGTVGLSRGITANLTSIGKIIIIMLMFIGRVGILTLTFTITTIYEDTVKIKYPIEPIFVG